MSAIATRPTGALLVGSVPLDDTDAVLTVAATHLGTHLRRIPDGETGTRTIWVTWQQGVFAEHPDLEEEPVPEGQYAPFPRYRVRAGVDPAAVRFGDLGYARFAIESYERFAALKRAGAIPGHIRFQISLPTPLSPLNNFAAVDQRAALEPAYEEAMLREVDAIAAALPHDEIAIQWDIAFEMGFVEGIPHPMFTPWFDDPLGGSVARIARAGERVPDDIEIGHHLCYGDFGHEHFLQPGDAGHLVEMANAIHAGTDRPIGVAAPAGPARPRRRGVLRAVGRSAPASRDGAVPRSRPPHRRRGGDAGAHRSRPGVHRDVRRRDRMRVRPAAGRHRRAAPGPARRCRGPRRLTHTRGAITT